MKSGRTVFPPAPGLWAQALWALLAAVGAYLLTVALSIACLALPWWMLQTFIDSKLSYAGWQGLVRIWGISLLGCLVAGGFGTCVLSLWLLLPRRIRFRPPGPRCWRDKEPRLFAEVQAVA